MKDNPKVECNGGTEEEQSSLEVLVSLPDKNVKVSKSLQKKKICFYGNVHCMTSDTVDTGFQLEVQSMKYCSLHFVLLFPETTEKLHNV